jgi:hypothetical protein
MLVLDEQQKHKLECLRHPGGAGWSTCFLCGDQHGKNFKMDLCLILYVEILPANQPESS